MKWQQTLVFWATLTLLVSPIALAEPAQKSPQNNEKKKKSDSRWGIGLGSGWIFDYPGSKEERIRFLAMPVYKGKYITVDRQDGVKGKLISQGRFRFSVSFSFLLPANSSRIPIRQGMPNLDWTLQLGPEVLFYVVRNTDYSIYLRLPFRFVAATNFKDTFSYQGWNLSPSLRSEISLGDYGELTTRFELEYASEYYADYYHQVDPKFATSFRPAFNATEGFMEYIIGVGYSYTNSFPWNFTISANLYLLGDSANYKSPLLLKTTNRSLLGAIIYYF